MLTRKRCSSSPASGKIARRGEVPHYSASELTFQAYLALHELSCCCCGYTSPLLDAARIFPAKISSHCRACTHIACDHCIVSVNQATADEQQQQQLNVLPPAADYHQVPVDAGSILFGYICRSCGSPEVVETKKKTSPMHHHQATMVVFAGETCQACGQAYGPGRMKFKVAKGEAFVRETGETEVLTPPAAHEKSGGGAAVTVQTSQLGGGRENADQKTEELEARD